MRPFSFAGKIITESINTRELEAGTIGVIGIEDKEYCVTLTHIEDGQWHVEGDYEGVIDDDVIIYRFSVILGSVVRPIAFNHWKIIIQDQLHERQRVHFMVKPYRFTKGGSMQCCGNCAASFRGSKSQPYCKKCCSELAVAYLDKMHIKKSAQSIKVSSRDNWNEVEALLLSAYTFGETHRLKQFKDWLKEKKNGYNSITKTDEQQASEPDV